MSHASTRDNVIAPFSPLVVVVVSQPAEYWTNLDPPRRPTKMWRHLRHGRKEISADSARRRRRQTHLTIHCGRDVFHQRPGIPSGSFDTRNRRVVWTNKCVAKLWRKIEKNVCVCDAILLHTSIRTWDFRHVILVSTCSKIGNIIKSRRRWKIVSC